MRPGCGSRSQQETNFSWCARRSARQDRRSDPRQLIGERSCQNIVMQLFCCGREPRSKAMLCPVCWSEQNNASALHEQRAQVAIAALADAPKDRPVTCRHLPHRRVLALIFSSDIIHWRRCGELWPRIWPGRLLLFLMAAVAAELRGRRRCARARELTVRGLLAAIAAVSNSVLASRVFAVCKSARPKPSVNVPYIGASRSRASD